MKDRMAVAMLQGAKADGDLDPGQHIVEFTGGSTGSSLALVCGVLDYPLTLVTADCFAEEKIRTMQAFGATVEVLETPDGKIHPGLVEELEARVDELVPEQGAFFTDQFNNPRHPEGYRPLGHEIVADCPDVTDFVVGVGTGGCAMGTAAGIRDEREDVTVTVVEPDESSVLTDGRSGSHSIEGVAIGIRPPFLVEDRYDVVMTVLESMARRMATELATKDGCLRAPVQG